ncbi:C4-dicarboxylate transporter/malic acid transporter [Coccidioides immitis RS]|uniref:C4-dicarboxylate transporter/malic acid transporter n=4 Tax=Coccidioides immitis TaxID=5501 RepID=J3K5Q7_COCIM|nr:C4-dicarboxylate transporter/malic acid transporter [Coccidioides immitis RS]KMP06820.1 malic acid transport protein Mae1 [Coccidioides immitis RMSCC 2394]KMU79300.1 malic acid transport protein Mae1 [Coccidioides immitis RMSCC 3703]KMU91610.1 malic acid transport protein Mae1 [Coccidioides immitis H538.4]TPX22296.1 hypothetical protein DIZ76_014164 [Coccidioides immitis]EAS29798.3 C4-dicarboxylate transporter/malic acid transporter [Coccidioides immitis RS]
MQSSCQLPRHLRRPGDDGYRTPTIEDVEEDSASAVALPPESFDTELTPVPTVMSRYRRSYVSQADGHHLTGDERRPSVPGADHSVTGASLALVDSFPTKLSWKERMRHFTWAYFTLTMATGGLANVLYKVPYRFYGLDTIAIIVFITNMALYVIIWALLLLRFYLFPYTFKASFLHPTESLFVPATIVSFGTILINIAQYGLSHTGKWLENAVVILFWFYAALAVAASSGIYLVLWSTQTFTIAQMTPIWIFPAYPMLIIGTHAGTLSTKLAQENAWRIIIGGNTIQGVGFLVSMMVYSAFIYRLMTQKLPKENLRPGMFVSVGPSAFTVVGLVSMGSSAHRAVPEGFLGDAALSGKIICLTAYFASLWLWGLAIFFFFIAVFAHTSTVGSSTMIFSMTWFSFVFPNTALVAATFAIGEAFSSRAINIIGCVMTVMLFCTYFFVVFMMIRAIKLRHILWPQKGEDRDEGGFRTVGPHGPS